MNITRILKSSLVTIWIILVSLFSSKEALADKFETNTEFFRIIFDEGLEKEAYELKQEADEVAALLFDLFDFKPKNRMTISISEDQIENAFVNIIHPSTIFLFPNVPRQIDKNYGRLMRYLLSHELTHAILASMSPWKIGENHLFPFTVPRWVHEGAAVYVETLLSQRGGRGRSNIFKNLPKSFKSLGFKHFNPHSHAPYSLGYNLLDFYAKLRGEQELFAMLKRRAISISPFTIHNFMDVIKQWSSSVEKSTLVGEKFCDKETTQLTGAGEILVFQDSDDYLIRMNVKNGKKRYQQSDSLSDIFYDGESIITTKLISVQTQWATKRESVSYINGRFLPIEDVKLVAKYGKEIIFVARKNGRESLHSTKRGTLIPKELNLIFTKITSTKYGIFFQASDYAGTEEYLFLFQDGVQKICRCNSFSIYEDKIYLTKDFAETIALYEYSIPDRRLYKLTEGDTIVHPVRLDNEIFFLQFDEGRSHIYKLRYESLSRKEERVSLSPHIPIEEPEINLDRVPYSPQMRLALPQIYFENWVLSFSQPITNELGSFYIAPIVQIPRLLAINFHTSFYTMDLAYFLKERQARLSIASIINKVFCPWLNIYVSSKLSIDSLLICKANFLLENCSFSMKVDGEVILPHLSPYLSLRLDIWKTSFRFWFSEKREINLLGDNSLYFIPGDKVSARTVINFRQKIEIPFTIERAILNEATLYLDEIQLIIAPGLIVIEERPNFYLETIIEARIKIYHSLPLKFFFQHIYTVPDKTGIFSFGVKVELDQNFGWQGAQF